jgi:hypothetical protein
MSSDSEEDDVARVGDKRYKSKKGNYQLPLILDKNNDEYYTPKYAWANIEEYLPKNLHIWEAFHGNGWSAQFLRELGCTNVTSEDIDFYDNDIGDIVISNPPFSDKKPVVTRLFELKKPFILIMSATTLSTKYMREYKDELSILVPPKRIHFLNQHGIEQKQTSFNCYYFCWRVPGIEPGKMKII